MTMRYKMTLRFDVDSSWPATFALFESESFTMRYYKGIVPPHKVEIELNGLSEKGVENTRLRLLDYGAKFTWSAEPLNSEKG